MNIVTLPKFKNFFSSFHDRTKIKDSFKNPRNNKLDETKKMSKTQKIL